MNKKLLLPLLVVVGSVVVAATILASRTEVERRADATPAPLVRVQAVTLEDAQLIVRGQGSARPAIDTTLVAEVAGRVSSVAANFADGGAFTKGERLLTIEPRDYQLNVAQAEANVAQAQVALDRELAEAEIAVGEWQDLGLGEAPPLASRQPQLAEARARLAAAQASLEKARLDLSRTIVRAPFDGRIRSKVADLGRYVAPGTVLAQIFSTRYAEVPLALPQQDLAFLDLALDASEGGADVEFTATIAGRTHRWRGRVVRTSHEFDPKTRMMTLFARIDDPSSDGDLALPMGTFLDAAITGRRASRVATMPRAALREGNRLLVVDDANRLRFREVEVLRIQQEEALISGGIEAGELVCVSALEAPVDGMEVRTLLEASSAATSAAETRL